MAQVWMALAVLLLRGQRQSLVRGGAGKSPEPQLVPCSFSSLQLLWVSWEGSWAGTQVVCGLFHSGRSSGVQIHSRERQMDKGKKKQLTQMGWYLETKLLSGPLMEMVPWSANGAHQLGTCIFLLDCASLGCRKFDISLMKCSLAKRPQFVSFSCKEMHCITQL